jgi:acyl transferase domain-containing protein/NADPH:quinone reductase-like Zn-dependent oxidoreductase/predicted O-methyltransferase YrrM/acyl carrier protein
MSDEPAVTATADAIAIIGMALRVPGADSVEQFWQNLRAGRESITFFTDQELRDAGVDPAALADPRYVKANGVLRGADLFDAGFFGFSPREAEAMDPQQRVFLELAWEALERAGYDPGRTPGRVGVFAGAGLSTYLLRNLVPNRAFAESVGELPLLLGNNKDFVPTRVSYKLNLRGPSANVSTACSTSLVAAHLACQSLLDFHCDLALAGGVSVQVPQVQGYFHAEGGIGSPDGHCRAFDAQARGTVSGNGAGIVVLKRLSEALADGDVIHAVIRGSAVNNDGADKVGFTAPSVSGQSQVIAEALEVAGVKPEEISYVEAHGTGTELGDPIEVAALSEVFGDGDGREQRCALGSVKTNVGHLDEAAGAAGLIKTVLALEQRELPPSLHYSTPNPKIDFAGSAFAVNPVLTPWCTPAGVPRRAGVSSFGLGGTNAHVILEEAPPAPASGPGRSRQLLALSAKTPAALARGAANLADWLEADRGATSLADVGFTLAQGRRPFAHRATVIAEDATEAVRLLRNHVATAGHSAPERGREVVFLFSGQGSQYPRMLAGLYASEPVVRDVIDRGAGLLGGVLGFDLRELLASEMPEAATRLKQTAVAQPALFLADYALAELWRSWGVKPAALIGHSLGEYVAACVAGVFSFEDALALVAARGALMQAQPAGGMLAVGLGEKAAKAVAATHGLELAAVNAPDACVLSGAEAGLAAAAVWLAGEGVAAARLETSHAFHSAMMEPVLAPLAARVRNVRRKAPQIPIVSNVTGQWLASGDAQDPAYWARQVRAPVRFAEGIALARSAGDPLLLEVGPGRALASMAQRIIGRDAPGRVLTSARTASQSTDDLAHLLTTLGKLWEGCVALDWKAFYATQTRHRVVLPTYAFERQRYWVEAPRAIAPTPAGPAAVPVALREQLPALARLEREAAADPARTEAPTYAAFSEAIGKWCGERLFGYFAAGLRGVVRGRRQSLAEVRQALGIVPAFAKAFDYFIAVLDSDGYLRVEGSGLVWLRDLTTVRPASRGRDELLRQFPEFRGIVRLVEHCVSNYPAALGGSVPAITVLYPDGRSDLLEASARDSGRTTNKDGYIGLLQAALQERAARTGKPFRLLEVGVGDGLLAGRIAPALQAANIEYTATDLSRAFVSKAEKAAAAAGLRFLKFGVLDISRDPVAQGFAAGSFDAVICLDVIHATPRLGETLGHLRTLLAPGGLLGVIEKVRLERWIDFVWGLAEGWWYFADQPLRQHSPLLKAGQWERLLRDTGFADVAVLPADAAARAATDYALLLGEREAATAASEPARALPLADWFNVPGWREAAVRAVAAPPERHVVLIGDGDAPLARRVAEHFRAAGRNVTVVAGNGARTADEWQTLLLPGGRSAVDLVHFGGCGDAVPVPLLLEMVQIASVLAGGTGPSSVSLITTEGWATAPQERVRPDRALLVGPLRVIPLEYPNVMCRGIDVAPDDDGAAAAIVAELAGDSREPVVAWRKGRRYVQRVTHRRFGETKPGTTSLREQGVYLITGAFGSMGRAFARELAHSVHARLVLVGRRIDGVAQQQLQADLVAAGAEVLAVQADVADQEQMARVVARAKERFGTIHGVLHTAGVYGQGLMAERSRAVIEATLAPKVAGVQALAWALDGLRPDFVMLCSSLASFRPVAGQVDYCAANAFLDAWATEHTRRTGVRTISVAWGMWQELGMMEHPAIAAAQQTAVRAEIVRAGWQSAGVEVFRRILEHGAAGTIIVSPQPLRPGPEPTHPLLDARTEQPRWVEYRVRIDPRRDWIANEHRLEGCAILPGTGHLELARAAFAEEHGTEGVELRDVYFLSPLVFAGDEPREIRVLLRDGAFRIVSRVGDDAWIEHVRGEIGEAEAAPGPRPAALAVSALAVPEQAVPFGPRWRNLRTIAFGENTGVATLELPAEFAADLAGYPLHPALLDLATGFMTLRHPLPDSLPFSYRRVTVRRALPARVRSEVRVTASTSTTLEMDAMLADEEGRICVELAGYQLRRMPVARATEEADNARLTIRAQGGIESLGLVRASRREPGAGEVELRVEAAGLNFIEVLYALGMLPATPELEMSFGLECAGTVVRVGPGVTGCAPGDPILAYANGCFAAYVTVPVDATAPRPAGISAVEAATMPAAFATAHHALITQARLARGERVLIHAAAGGVGQAAVQIAQAIGAEIFATAGSPEKRAALQAMGVSHVTDSRSLAFADEVRAATGGRGVDVVLNSLSGDFMRASLELVAPHGRFLELGKRDLFAGGTLGLKPFTRIISFMVIDVGPDLPGFGALWRAVSERMATGTYRPLPHRAFPLTEAREAFEHMARARHIGKVVLTVGEPEPLIRAAGTALAGPRGRPLAAILGLAVDAASTPATAVPAATASGHARPALATAYVPPADETERAIAAVWQELLGIAQVGAQDNFFDLHGDSLLAAQVMARVHAALQVKLPLSALFDAPTVAGLAARVRAAKSGPAAVAAQPAGGGKEVEGEL